MYNRNIEAQAEPSQNHLLLIILTIIYIFIHFISYLIQAFIFNMFDGFGLLGAFFLFILLIISFGVKEIIRNSLRSKLPIPSEKSMKFYQLLTAITNTYFLMILFSFVAIDSNNIWSDILNRLTEPTYALAAFKLGFGQSSFYVFCIFMTFISTYFLNFITVYEKGFKFKSGYKKSSEAFVVVKEMSKERIAHIEETSEMTTDYLSNFFTQGTIINTRDITDDEVVAYYTEQTNFNPNIDSNLLLTRVFRYEQQSNVSFIAVYHITYSKSADGYTTRTSSILTNYFNKPFVIDNIELMQMVGEPDNFVESSEFDNPENSLEIKELDDQNLGGESETHDEYGNEFINLNHK